jgi:uncharacterized protein
LQGTNEVHFFCPGGPPLKNELHLLIELQKIDNQFRDLEVSKGTLPQELERLEKEERELTAARESHNHRVTELNLDLKKRETRDVELKEKVRLLQERLFATQTNQEYEAVTREIDWHQDAIGDNDKVMQDGLEELDAVTNSLTEGTERESERSKLLERMRAQYEEHNVSTAGIAKELDVKREALVEKIPKPLMGHYERIRKAKDGRSVVSIYRGTSCGGCFQTLPPQKINQVRHMSDLVLCEICGRVIISDLLEENL